MAQPKQTVTTSMESLPAFVLLSTLTFGLYLWYWGWRAWALERGLSDRKLNATLRAAFLGFTLFSLVISLNKRLKQGASKDLIFSVLYFAVSVFGGVVLLVLEQTPSLPTVILGSLLAGFLSALVLMPVRNTVHAVWTKYEDEMPRLPRMARNVKLIVALCILEVAAILGWLPLAFGGHQ